MSDVTTVAIVGGGIAGLTVAHELSKHPKFRVHVYEQNDIFGKDDETARRLAEFLQGFAERERADAEEVEIPASTLELLRSLGYVQ